MCLTLWEGKLNRNSWLFQWMMLTQYSSLHRHYCSLFSLAFWFLKMLRFLDFIWKEERGSEVQVLNLLSKGSISKSYIPICSLCGKRKMARYFCAAWPSILSLYLEVKSALVLSVSTRSSWGERVSSECFFCFDIYANWSSAEHYMLKHPRRTCEKGWEKWQCPFSDWLLQTDLIYPLFHEI